MGLLWTKWAKGKRICAGLCPALCMLLLCACLGVPSANTSIALGDAAKDTDAADSAVRQPTDGPTAGAANTATPRQKVQPNNADGAYSYQFTVAGVAYVLPCPLWFFLEDGWQPRQDPDAQLEAGHRADVTIKNGTQQLVLQVANTAQTALPLQQCSVAGLQLSAEDTTTPEISLAGGVMLGTPRQTVLDAWGQPDTPVGSVAELPANEMHYTGGRNAYIMLQLNEQELVAHITIWNLYPPAAPPLPEELPLEVQAYTPPEQPADDWQQFAIRYGGDMYILPAPVAAFLHNGWVLRDEQTLEPGHWTMRVCLQKGNQVLRTTLRNYSASPQPLTGCFVTMVESSKYSADISLELTGGLHQNSTPEEVAAILGDWDLRYGGGLNSWDITYWNADKTGKMIFRFRHSDDRLMDLEVWHEPAQLP